jgi:hypothetical protein
MVFLIVQEQNSGRNQLEQDKQKTTALVLVSLQHCLCLLMVDYKKDVRKQQRHILLYKVKCLLIKD